MSMQPSFQDFFSKHSADYAKYRPRYPSTFFRSIQRLSPSNESAWDCGCGNGQASIGLAEYFDQVIATDASSEQIANTVAHPRVRYQVAKAESSGLPAASFDAILIAQALHWFDHEPFYEEVRRVAKPGAIVVAAMYEMAIISPEIDELILKFYHGKIAPFWPEDRRHIETHYTNIPWPFAQLNFPQTAMEAMWNLEEMLNYLSTWSAVRRYIAATSTNPLEELKSQLLDCWSVHETRKICWPLTVLAGTVF